MEAINYVLGWSGLAIKIIPVATGATVAYFALKSVSSDDDGSKASAYDNIKKTLKAGIILTSMTGFIEIVKRFFI